MATSDQQRPEVSLAVYGLCVALPDGTALIEDLQLEARRGEAIVVIGPSGAGKSTLLRALFDREAMSAEGFLISSESAEIRSSLGLVPQRGALFDHVDVAENLGIALRAAGRASTVHEIARWLTIMGLDPEWASTSRPVASLRTCTEIT